MHRLSLAAVLALCAIPTLRAAETAGSTAGRFRFDLRNGSDVLVLITIDGQGPFRFLLDTGSSRTGVTAALARRLGLRPGGSTRMLTPTGEVTRPLVLVPRLVLGDSSSVSLHAAVLPANGTFDDRLDGLIGRDILASRAFTIDYQRQHVDWHADVPIDIRGQRLQLLPDEGRFLVELPQPGRSTRPLRVLPDTGADSLVLFAAARDLVSSYTLLHFAPVRTVSGYRLSTAVQIDRLDVGDIPLRNLKAVLVHAGAPHPALGDGLLPLHLFKRVTINGPEGYVILQ